MPTAFSILPERFEDGRHKAMEQGLAAAGWSVVHQAGKPQSPEDVLITWTRHKGWKDQQATAFEQAGGSVIVAEEPHLKGVPPGLSERLYCLSVHDHQAGWWYIGGPERWDSFGIDLHDWRGSSKPEDMILVREQRGIGSPKTASPQNWHHEMIGALKAITGRTAQILEHPKNLKKQGRTPNAPWDKLREICHALVTWNSHDGTLALIHGVPVFCMAKHAFFKASACDDLGKIEQPWRPDNRLDVMRNLAWAHWTASEIKSGEAFHYLRKAINEPGRFWARVAR